MPVVLRKALWVVFGCACAALLYLLFSMTMPYFLNEEASWTQISPTRQMRIDGGNWWVFIWLLLVGVGGLALSVLVVARKNYRPLEFVVEFFAEEGSLILKVIIAGLLSSPLVGLTVISLVSVFSYIDVSTPSTQTSQNALQSTAESSQVEEASSASGEGGSSGLVFDVATFKERFEASGPYSLDQIGEGDILIKYVVTGAQQETRIWIENAGEIISLRGIDGDTALAEALLVQTLVAVETDKTQAEAIAAKVITHINIGQQKPSAEGTYHTSSEPLLTIEWITTETSLKIVLTYQ